MNHPIMPGSPTASENSMFIDLAGSEVAVAALATPSRTLRRSVRTITLQQKNKTTVEFEREVLDAFHMSRQMSIKKKRRDKKARVEAKKASNILQYSTHVVAITEEQLVQDAREDRLARFYDSIGGSSFLDEMPTEEHTTYVENPHNAAMDLPFEICARRMQLRIQEIDKYGWLEGWKYAALARSLDGYHRRFSDRVEITHNREKQMAAEEAAIKGEMIEDAAQISEPRNIFPEWYFYEQMQY